MLRAGVEGLAEGALRAGLERPVALAVTILTSDVGVPAHVFADRVHAAVEAGCGGVVCAGADVAEARRLAPQLLAVVPGIRPAGTPVHDQGRVATPAEALTAGADLLVVGRAVTAASDRRKAAAALAESLG
jgi:orotidine-5'-phosphate decarboxylase